MVTVLDKNVLLDSFCGEVELDMSEYTADGKVDNVWEITKNLMDKKNAEPHAGTIKIRVLASFSPDL